MPRHLPLLLLIPLLPTNAHAYLGPGSGLLAIIIVLIVISAIGMLIFGFVWYPLKRLLRSRQTADDESG